MMDENLSADAAEPSEPPRPEPERAPRRAPATKIAAKKAAAARIGEAGTPVKRAATKRAPGKKAAGRVPPKKAAVEPPKAVVEPPKAVVEPPKAVVEPPKAAVEPPKAAVESPKAAVESPKAAVESPKQADVEPVSAEPVSAESVVTESVVVSEPAVVVEPVAAASAAEVERAWQDNTLAQVLYHDWEAGTYDEKWSISFDDRCISYARDRFSSLVGAEVLRTEPWPYRRTLEIGAGTGFFALNLKQAGVLDEVHVSDVSAGMVENAQRNAHGLGFEVTGTVAGAEKLPYDDDTFDLVIGHAVIHHIPDVEAALREVLRVLRPGGRFAIAGEPTQTGDWYARRLGRVTWKLTTAATQLPPLREKWARSQEELDESSRAAALEAVVDLHTFVPAELEQMAQRVGAAEVRVQTEELLAAFLGWPVRTFEAAVNPEALGWRWASFAYRSWQRLSALDRVLARALPASIFYNVGVTGIKPVR